LDSADACSIELVSGSEEGRLRSFELARVVPSDELDFTLERVVIRAEGARRDALREGFNSRETGGERQESCEVELHCERE
jgi:hypothetical protein